MRHYTSLSIFTQPIPHTALKLRVKIVFFFCWKQASKCATLGHNLLAQKWLS